MDDVGLVTEFIEQGNEDAFQRIIDRHSGMVYGVCFREFRDRATAEDASQAVFITLAKKARRIRNKSALSSWLFRTANLVVANMKRVEERRRRHETMAGEMKRTQLNGKDKEAGWQDVQKHLNMAIERLGTKQKQAVIRHFLEEKPQKKVAEELGCSEEAIQMRISRALEKIRKILKRKGVTVPVVALTGFLAQRAGEAAPTELAASCHAASMAALAGNAAGFTKAILLSQGVIKMMMWAKVKTVAACVAVLMAAGVCTTPAVMRAVAGDEKKPAADMRNANQKISGEEQKKPFIPKGGRIIARVKLPGMVDPRSKLLWNPAGDRVLVLERIKEASPFEYDCAFYSVALSGTRPTPMGRYSYTASREGRPKLFWLAGNRVLSRSEAKLSVTGLDGNSRKIPFGDGVYAVSVSPDGKYALVSAYRKATADAGRALLMGILSAENEGVRAIDLPTLKAPLERRPHPGGREFQLYVNFKGWRNDGRAILVFYWFRPTYQYRNHSPFTFDPATGRFSKVDLLRSPGEMPSLDEMNAAPVWDLGDGLALRRLKKEGTKVKKRLPGSAKPQRGKVSQAVTAIALEVLRNGQVAVRIPLDPRETGGGDVCPKALSADGRYLLLESFTSLANIKDTGISGWIPPGEGWHAAGRKIYLLTDLAKGEIIPSYRLDTSQWFRQSIVAVMSPSREVLIGDAFRDVRTMGIRAIGFDSRVQNVTPTGVGSWNWSFCAHGGFRTDRVACLAHYTSVALPDTEWMRLSEQLQQARRNGNEKKMQEIRAKMKTRMQSRLYVCWNSAKPILAWAAWREVTDAERGSRKKDFCIHHVTWNLRGDLLAFMGGDTLCVWKPTSKPGEPLLPDGNELPESYEVF